MHVPRFALMAIVAINAAAFTHSALAADECKNPQSQSAMNICADLDYRREDALLNKNYHDLIAKIDTERRTQLKDVQLAWIKFRDLQCHYDADQYQGGTIYPLEYSSCLTAMTYQRNKDLKIMLDEVASH